MSAPDQPRPMVMTIVETSFAAAVADYQSACVEFDASCAAVNAALARRQNALAAVKRLRTAVILGAMQ